MVDREDRLTGMKLQSSAVHGSRQPLRVNCITDVCIQADRSSAADIASDSGVLTELARDVETWGIIRISSVRGKACCCMTGADSLDHSADIEMVTKSN